MTETSRVSEIARRTIAFRPEGADRVEVRHDLSFPAADGIDSRFDLYLPPPLARCGANATVVLVPGYPDPGFQRFVGCRFKEMGSSVSWARAIAAAGMAAAVPSCRAPEADALALFGAFRDRATELGLDPDRVGLWASSGNAPLALSLLMPGVTAARVVPRCAALLYPFLLDLDGARHVADAAATFRFANPCAGRALADLPRATPLLALRAGADETAHLNESLDRFVERALGADLPLTLVNLPGAPHAFDLYDESPTAEAAIRQVLDFLRLHLLDGVASASAGLT